MEAKGLFKAITTLHTAGATGSVAGMQKQFGPEFAPFDPIVALPSLGKGHSVK